MRILITGVCGFVGSAIARSLRAAEPGMDLAGIDNFSRRGSEGNKLSLQKIGVDFYPGDIRSEADLKRLPRADWVIDAAAYPSVLAGIGNVGSRDLIENNVFGTVNILEYCKRHRAGMILISTSRVYSIALLTGLKVDPVGEAFHLNRDQALPPGLSASGLSEEFSTQPPISLYGSTKLASEILALEYGEAFGFPVWINRCGVMSGAGQFGTSEQGVFSYWIHSWLRKRPLQYLGFGGKGYQVRDCMHPKDLAVLILQQMASNTGSRPRIVNLGGGADNALSLAQLSAWCTGRFGARAVSGDPAMRRFDVPWLIMDPALARATWGWQPHTKILDILEEIAVHAEQNPEWLERTGRG